MNLFYVLLFAVVLEIGAAERKRRPCRSFKDCNEEECCISRGILGILSGVCKPLAQKDEPCSRKEETNVFNSRQYSTHCPCATGLSCEREEIEMTSAIRIFTERCVGDATRPEGKGTTMGPGRRGTTRRPGRRGTTMGPGRRGTTMGPGRRGTTMGPGRRGTTMEPQVKVTTMEPQMETTTMEPQMEVTTMEPQMEVTTMEPQMEVTTMEPERELMTTEPPLEASTVEVESG